MILRAEIRMKAILLAWIGSYNTGWIICHEKKAHRLILVYLRKGRAVAGEVLNDQAGFGVEGWI